MSAAAATMMNLCCASSGTQMLQSAYEFPRTFLRLCSQRHANVNSSRLVAEEISSGSPAEHPELHQHYRYVTPLMVSDCFISLL